MGSHYHFAETNAALAFDRQVCSRMSAGHSRGNRGALRAGTVPRSAADPLCGARLVYGFNGWSWGRLPHVARRHERFLRIAEVIANAPHNEPRRLRADVRSHGGRQRSALRIADLIIEVEQDLTIYGEEVKFGGGKVIRDGMGQSQRSRREGAVDTVITNALILDHWGIVKADIGIRDGRIAAIGKAGNPDVQPNVTSSSGPGTEVIAGEGKIVTAGGIDLHVHFICPQQIEEALYSGITTMMGGGTGPAAGTTATTCTPGPWHIRADARGCRCVSDESRILR